MKQVYIIDCKRSAIGKYNGAISSLSATEIIAKILDTFLQNNQIYKKKIDQVIMGNVLAAGLGQNPARLVSLKAGLSEKIPAFTVNQACTSGLLSVVLGIQAIQNTNIDLVLAGGMENMSKCPYYLFGYREGIKYGHQKIVDGMIQDGLWCSITNKHMGSLAEEFAKKYQISRLQQDDYAFNSHKKTIKAIQEGKFKKEIIPLEINKKKKKTIFKIDEQPREDTSLEKLKKLKPAFKKKGTITAGNASSLNDGAAIVFLASEKFINKNKIKPLVKISSYAISAVSPKFFGLSIFDSIKKCLNNVKVEKEKVELWEINEAFACQMIVIQKMLKINKNIFNVNGGAISLGHPIGASGARILTTLIHEMKRRKSTNGLASICAGGGLGTSILLSNI